MNIKSKIPVLLIENEEADAQKTKIFVEESGVKCDVHHAKSLFEGLNMAVANKFDLAILELNLPDSSGFKTVASFLERAIGTPVIVFTHTNNEIIGNQAVKAGAQDFLVKNQTDAKLFGRCFRNALQRSKVQLRLEMTAKELETNKKRFLEAQEMARFGTWEMDIVSNNMKWSDEIHRIFCFHPGSISPSLSDYLNYVHVEDKDLVENFFDALIRNAEQLQIEHRILVEGTNLRYVTIQGKIQMEDDSSKILLVGTIQDITDRKISEKLIIEKNLSSKTAKVQEEVLADLSFQIRTPLSSVVNLLFLLENTEKSSLQANYISNLKTAVDDLALSVNNLMNFSVMVTDNVKLDEEEFNIREFLQGTKNVVNIKAEKAGIKLGLNLSDQLPEKILSDQKKLTQILYNLIDNAIKFTGTDGHAIVSARTVAQESGEVTLVLSVQDNGKGMDKEKIAQLLEADKLLLESIPEDEPNKKRPLGIAIVAKLVKNMGGQIAIESRIGKGTDFTISIPIKVPLQAKHLQGDRPIAPISILLVEDHFLNQMATKKVLTNWSDFVTVDIADNGQIGVDMFQENGYDLILMDIQMPVMSGLEAAKKIREFSQVPIIALTANSTKQEQDKCLEIGMNDYLSKPFKPQDLHARIMSTMAKALTRATN